MKACEHCGAELQRKRREGARDWTSRRFCGRACFLARPARKRSPYKKLKLNGRTVSEHRHIAEQALGRALLPGEVVHHRNEERQDNRPENLEVMSHQAHQAHHLGKHPEIKTCEACGKDYVPERGHRGRQKTCSWDCRSKLVGIHQPGRKLDKTQRDEIAALVASGGLTKQAIADQYGISRRLVYWVIEAQRNEAEEVLAS